MAICRDGSVAIRFSPAGCARHRFDCWQQLCIYCGNHPGGGLAEKLSVVVYPRPAKAHTRDRSHLRQRQPQPSTRNIVYCRKLVCCHQAPYQFGDLPVLLMVEGWQSAPLVAGARCPKRP